MSTRWLSRFAVLALSFCVLLFAGCGEKGCFVVSQDAKGIQAKAPVLWQDAYVGTVSSVEVQGNGTKVSLDVKSEFADKIRAGVAARIVLDDKFGGTPFVLLVGGKDATMPPLADGAQIPEASPVAQAKEGLAGFMDWFRGSAHMGEKAGGGVLLVLCAALAFVKKVVKLIIKVLILGVLILIVFFAKNDWASYKEKISTTKEQVQSAQAWMTEHSETLKKLLQQVVPAESK